MKFMKKFLYTILSVATLFSVASCTVNNNEPKVNYKTKTGVPSISNGLDLATFSESEEFDNFTVYLSLKKEYKTVKELNADVTNFSFICYIYNNHLSRKFMDTVSGSHYGYLSMDGSPVYFIKDNVFYGYHKITDEDTEINYDKGAYEIYLEYHYNVEDENFGDCKIYLYDSFNNINKLETVNYDFSEETKK